jgi:hypothetical protein
MALRLLWKHPHPSNQPVYTHPFSSSSIHARSRGRKKTNSRAALKHLEFSAYHLLRGETGPLADSVYYKLNSSLKSINIPWVFE